MKKICYILVLVLSISLLVACGTRHSVDEPTIIPDSTDSVLQTGDDNDSSDVLQTDNGDDPSNDLQIGATDRINNIFSQDAIECRFYSIEDLETYLFTGSTQAIDYAILPEFDAFPQINDYKTHEYAKVGYVSLEKIYGISVDDVDSFDSVTFQLSTDFIVYNYYFDTNCITVIYSPGCFKGLSTADYYSAYSNYSLASYSPTRYAESSKVVDGYVLREYGEKEIVYTYRNGIPRIAGMLQGEYFLSITTASSSDVETARTEYLNFMTSDDFASISALFSTDLETFGAAINKTEKFNSK